jgi:DNA-binding IscR family transcriptional regulator
MKEVRDAIATVLEQVTVAQLCDRSRQLRGEQLDPFDYVI